MQSLHIYLPEDTTQMPQYRIENRYYRVDTLERLPQEVSNIALGMYPMTLNSKPVLVRKRNGREWILFDTNGTELRTLGSSNRFERVGPFLPLVEMKIPDLQQSMLNEFREVNLPPFNPVMKGRIAEAIASNRPFPVPNHDVALDPIQMEAYSLNPQVMSEQESRVPQIMLERRRQFAEAQEELARSITQTSLNTFHRAGNSDMSRVREVLQGPTPAENKVQPQSYEDLYQLSYETLTKQLYGLPVIIPEFLILNGLKVNFIPFSQLSTIQIQRYIIEPLLQPWAGPPVGFSGENPMNRIITIFGTNGMTYLVKSKYDPISNQIFPPV